MEHMQRWAKTRRVSLPEQLGTRLLPALGMAVLLIGGGIGSGTIRHDPSPAFLARWGYDLDALRAGRLHTLFTMTLFPTAHSDWLPMLLQTVVLVALIGWFAGAWWAVIAFWGPTIVGTALVSLCIIWPLDAAGVGFAHRWATEPDSGASVGIYGARGFLLALLPRRVRWLAVAAMTAWLVLDIAREHHVWNSEHLGGYLLGVLLGAGGMRGRHGIREAEDAVIPRASNEQSGKPESRHARGSDHGSDGG